MTNPRRAVTFGMHMNTDCRIPQFTGLFVGWLNEGEKRETVTVDAKLLQKLIDAARSVRDVSIDCKDERALADAAQSAGSWADDIAMEMQR